MAQIKKVSDAWMWLGVEMERLEREKSPRYSQFLSGLCGPLKFGNGVLGARVLDALGFRMAQRLASVLEKHYWDSENPYLGKDGADYGVRALWCYLMAEVTRGA